MTFDQSYYENIWGTVHRHDYCDSLAQMLIDTYGKCRILDIGTGCGYLVKRLRELGCDAWGLELSEYALANSCAPQHVRRGDMRDIPFAANSFDVVHTNGVWGYFPEEDVAKAVAECKRVGTQQHHNIDVDDTDPTHQYVLIRSREWWNQLFVEPKILVGTSVHRVKEYSFQRWIDNVKAFTYPNFDILAVDNSADESMVAQYGHQVPMVHISSLDQQPETYHKRITESMAVIQQQFLAGTYLKWFNLECDVIPPRDIIEFMLQWGKDSDWISHCYPNRDNPANVQQGIGCSMLSRKLVSAFDFHEADSPDAWLWDKVRVSGQFKTMELWQYVDVQHLAR